MAREGRQTHSTSAIRTAGRLEFSARQEASDTQDSAHAGLIRPDPDKSTADNVRVVELGVVRNFDPLIADPYPVAVGFYILDDVVVVGSVAVCVCATIVTILIAQIADELLNFWIVLRVFRLPTRRRWQGKGLH